MEEIEAVLQAGEITEEEAATFSDIKLGEPDLLYLKREMEAREHAEKQLLQTAKLEVVGRLAGSIAHDGGHVLGQLGEVIERGQEHAVDGDAQAALDGRRVLVVDVSRPQASTAALKEHGNILVGITASDEVWIDRRHVDIRAVRANIERLRAENPEGAVVIQADTAAKTGLLVQVIDQARTAGVADVSIAAMLHD